MAKKKSSQSFEKALKELETLVEKMESGDTSLEQGWNGSRKVCAW
ncbi:MAG: hypothetical protein Ct9H300mP2_4050 [Candidatus Neomarinimicrobiota bacterium]|nr:MAG: hypothetical protein Ct9H300mP2_4050 [Candidatus Neomarinimicrobiota bacterium]